jgi:ankyrin repeat protein
MSAKQSPLPTVKWLVDELNVPSDVVNVNGHCAIHKCAIYGHCDVIDWLVETNKCGGCSEHWGKDDRGSDPSELAMTNGFHELSAKLRKMGDAISHMPVVYTGDVNVE